MIGNISAGLYGVGVAPSTNSYESISTVTVGAGGQASITFSSIPSTYKHLQLRILGSDDGAGSEYGNMTFNGDTAANYASHQLYGDGSSAAANAFPNNNQIYLHRISGSIANTFGAIIVDILDYASTTKNKTVRELGGYDANGSGRISFSSGVWMNTNAITSITATTGGSKWLQYTSFALYGIKDS
jgi:hypothetical protein